METLWFVLVAGMMVTYVVLDGFDLGVGVLYKVLGRSEEDRAVLRHAIGPVWDANEVWLLAAGGTLAFAFPALYAAAFSGFYLPLMMVLWLLIGRGLGLELRDHIPDPLGRQVCDAIFMISSALLAVVLGAALGNVVRGVPLDAEGYFFLPLWTNFRPGADPGVLDWYTILCGVVALVALATHGAHYLALRTSGDVNTRARRLALTGGRVLAGLLSVSLAASLAVRPGLLDNFRAHPVGLLIPVAVAAALVTMELSARRSRERAAFTASCVFLIGTLAGAAFALYPVLLPSSTDPARALTVHGAASGGYALRVALGWWIVGIALVAASFRYLYGQFRGKVTAGASDSQSH
jgi:cytochrome d ubiquinol oxidase subunit II